jgi:hypothetical protein
MVELLGYPDGMVEYGLPFSATSPGLPSSTLESLAFRELLDEGLEPHKVSSLLISSTPNAGHGVEITATFDLGDRLTRSPRLIPAWTRRHPMAHPRDFLEPMLRQIGTEMGCLYATSLDVISI